MSRFSRAVGTQFLVWSQAEGSPRIEYSASLIREARLEGTSGTLLGTRSGAAIRVVAARATVRPGDPRIAGLEPVGTFSVRPRGEVFLAEPELERFEQSKAAVALVVAGEKAGFFVRERDGSILSIRSRHEFACAAPPRAPRKWPVIAMAILVIAAFIALLASLRPLPVTLSVREASGALRIAWSRGEGRLDIFDGTSHRAIPISVIDSGLLYEPRSNDIEVRLTQRRGTRSARFLRFDPETERLASQIAELETESSGLRAELANRKSRATALEKTLSTMRRAH